MVWGVDLGGQLALSAVACFWPETGLLDTLAECGNALTVAQRGAQDGVGSLFEQAASCGELAVSDRRIPNVEALLHRALLKWGRPDVVVSDRFRIAELKDVGEKLLQDVSVVPRGQGFREGSDDVRRFQAAVKLAHVRPARKLVLLEAGIADAVVVTDCSGNAKLAKVKEGGRRAHARDDVAAAAILAVAHGARVRGAETARPNRPSAVIVG